MVLCLMALKCQTARIQHHGHPPQSIPRTREFLCMTTLCAAEMLRWMRKTLHTTHIRHTTWSGRQKTSWTWSLGRYSGLWRGSGTAPVFRCGLECGENFTHCWESGRYSEQLNLLEFQPIDFVVESVCKLLYPVLLAESVMRPAKPSSNAFGVNGPAEVAN